MRYLIVIITILFVTACSDSGEQQPDPVVIDLPLAYIERSFPVDDEGNVIEDVALEPQTFRPGAALFIKERATPSSAAQNITAALFDEGASYDVKDLHPSRDGKRLLFSMRAPAIEDADEDEQPTWNIWQYDLETAEFTRIISNDVDAEQGQDVSPAYLPDGRIVFSSTRQRRSKAILLDDNKPQFEALDEDRQDPTFNLHIVSEDGFEIEQISYNQSHDINPSVLADGRILFTRWDNFSTSKASWYTIEPSGFNLQPFYGHNSQTDDNDLALRYGAAVQLDDGRLLHIQKTTPNAHYGGDIVAIDALNFSDATQSIDGTTGVATSSLTFDNINYTTEVSRFGRYTFATPFADQSNRLLVGWSQCRITTEEGTIQVCTDTTVIDETTVEAQPQYGLWILDLNEETHQPLIVATAGQMISEAITLEPRTLETFIPAPTVGVDIDEALYNQNLGVINIRSVYDIDGVDVTGRGIAAVADPVQTPPDERSGRFLRLFKAVSQPPNDVQRVPGYAFGASGGTMREILGYVPIEPDGSVQVTVPADIAFSFDILDLNGHRVTFRHNNWLQLRPGEVKQCNGCHNSSSENPHGRQDAEASSAYAGATLSGAGFSNSVDALFADAGETMAEVYARINGTRMPNSNLVFTDEWTDTTLATAAADISWLYSELETPAPLTEGCQIEWNELCRTVIHYPEHIQPIWELDRQTFDENDELVSDNTCTSCHSPTDADGLFKDPNTYAQLDLTSTPSLDNSNQMTSFRELVFNDIPQELIDGVVSDVLVDVARLDENGDPVFEEDEFGNLVQVFDQVVTSERVTRSMRANNAAQSTAFFDTFNTGGSHEGYLSPIELFLISQWLDNGAQYYNDPFAVPEN